MDGNWHCRPQHTLFQVSMVSVAAKSCKVPIWRPGLLVSECEVARNYWCTEFAVAVARRTQSFPPTDI